MAMISILIANLIFLAFLGLTSVGIIICIISIILFILNHKKVRKMQKSNVILKTDGKIESNVGLATNKTPKTRTSAYKICAIITLVIGIIFLMPMTIIILVTTFS